MKSSHTDNQKWAAVQARDAALDHTFVYAVSSTKIYCRPSCSSRLANRKNVRFFMTPQAAKSAGYRACKRCLPDQPKTVLHEKAVRQACEIIHVAEDVPDLKSLARTAGLSPSHFQRVFKAQVGLSPKQYAMAVRKHRLRTGLPKAISVTHALYDAGYASSSRAYAEDDALGMAPKTYLKGAKGETIRFTTAASSLGEIMVATTDRGICMVEFGDLNENIEKLKARFGQATLELADDTIAHIVAQVVALIDAPNDHSHISLALLPLDIRGTAFQERVWRALTHIPLGQTVNYAQIAQKIGQPKAARAVARSCAANTLAVVVPCHRVVLRSGALSGYKWGGARKRALLDREAAAPVSHPKKAESGS